MSALDLLATEYERKAVHWLDVARNAPSLAGRAYAMATADHWRDKLAAVRRTQQSRTVRPPSALRCSWWPVCEGWHA